MDDGMQEVLDGELVKFEKEGTTIYGVLQAYRAQRDTGKGPGNVYEVKTKQGVAAFFAPSLLHKKLQPIPMGSVVKIIYTKMTKTANGNTLKNFTVMAGKPTEENLKAAGVLAMAPVEESKSFDNGIDFKADNIPY